MHIDCLAAYQSLDQKTVDTLLKQEAEKSNRKIVVLDDDPTGVQTVHDISVYTDWSLDSIRAGFAEDNKLFFILTNSRGFTVEQTTKAHTVIAERVSQVAAENHMDYLIISRGDSTLRGHYPLETELLREKAEEHNSWKMDGEILCPYFREGGRYTLNNVHYVKYGEELVPAGQTEFAGDETFGYKASNLCEYIEEKTKGAFRKEDCICISLESIRAMDIDGIEAQLETAENFQKIIVNAIDDYDVKVFSIALYRAMAKGYHYTIRCAAALVKALGNISNKQLLTRDEMVTLKASTGGIIVVGSHTKKTTAQLEELKKLEQISFLEMDSDLVLQNGALEQEVKRLIDVEEEKLQAGITVCISTKRAVLTVENDTPEKALLRSVAISDAVQSLVGRLYVVPAFVVAKGGITSSDVGTKALQVKCAKVLGQIQPGIPVWQTGAESRFPGTPYVIFPGNVGDVDTLRKAVEILLP
ncbi:MAG: four-carbon acid sugar kinase family protein [Lachnospiraceae bacterium]|nr:four-carbon acid sugar kinase family protein [Lachnospiraceae bacterium]